MSIENNNKVEPIKYMEDIPKHLLPSIEIEYVFTLGMSIGNGDIDNVPRDAIGAIIIQKYPYVDKRGEISLDFIEYGIYVGKTIGIDEALLKVADEAGKLSLCMLKDDGYEEVVIPLNSDELVEDFVVFDSDVSVVSSHEELVDIISKINLVYKAMQPTFLYPEIAFKGRSRKRVKDTN